MTRRVLASGRALFAAARFVGKDLADLGYRRDAEGVSLREAMAALDFDFDALPKARGIDGVGAYLELHIEQGPVLETGASRSAWSPGSSA